MRPRAMSACSTPRLPLPQPPRVMAEGKPVWMGSAASVTTVGVRPSCEPSDWRTRVWLELADASGLGFGNDGDLCASTRSLNQGTPSEPQEANSDSPFPPPTSRPVSSSVVVTLQLLHQCGPTCNYQRDLSGASAAARAAAMAKGSAASVSAGAVGGEDLHKILWYRFLGRYAISHLYLWLKSSFVGISY